MRYWCLWCRRWLSGNDVCEVLPGGCLYSQGAALCLQCCWHAHHGIALDERPRAPQSA